ncbi:MAG TPA: hypothetical protein VGN34_03410 [Ktedonobacteraceae bacterium]|jgi:predicted amino acid dehydrogenase
MIVYVAHVTNQMARIEGDFEKGTANGSMTMLEIIRQVSLHKPSGRNALFEQRG